MVLKKIEVELNKNMSKKVCFVTLMNISVVPYLYKYTELMKCDYEIIYWNRDAIKEKTNASATYLLEYPLPKGCSKLQKFTGYIKFRNHARRILKENDYDRVVLLSGNVAVLLKDILLAKYKGKYIIDIRDYFMENNKLYFNAEKKVINHSGLAVISSEAYKRFLPQHKYLAVHNSPNISDEQIKSFREKRELWRNKSDEKPITLSFIGGVRFFEQDKKVLSYFANDDRFFVRYIGSGANLLKEHCEKNGIKNVYLHDRFPPEQTLDFYADTDIILNLYGNGTPLLDYALSNKLYYAATLGIPILVCPNTFMEEVAVGNGFGFALDLDDADGRDKVYTYSVSVNTETFIEKCKGFMTNVEQDNSDFAMSVASYLHGEIN